jgi:hypothetical protein
MKIMRSAAVSVAMWLALVTPRPADAADLAAPMRRPCAQSQVAGRSRPLLVADTTPSRGPGVAKSERDLYGLPSSL